MKLSIPVSRKRGLITDTFQGVQSFKKGNGFLEKTLEEICSPALFLAIQEKRLESVEDLESYEWTEVVRAASHSSYVCDALAQHMGMRPLPIRSHLVSATSAESTDLKNNLKNKTPVRLHAHQIKAIRFMRQVEENSLVKNTFGLCGGIVQLTMGLGKTLLSIAYGLTAQRPLYNQEVGGDMGYPNLVIVNKLLMNEWKVSGFDKFFDSRVRVLYLHKDFTPLDTLKSLTRAQVVEYDFVITTYDVVCSVGKAGGHHLCCLEMGADNTFHANKVMCVHPKRREQCLVYSKTYHVPNSVGPIEATVMTPPMANTVTRGSTQGLDLLFAIPWERVFADESTRFCNYHSKTYQYLMAIYGRFKWCLSGKPIRNTSLDIWAQLRWCGYTGVTEHKYWKNGYSKFIEEHHIHDHILSMDYSDTDISLPPIHRIEKRVPFDEQSEKCYVYVQKVARKMFDDALSGAATFAGVLKLLTRLRQCCIAPYIMMPESKRSNEKSMVLQKKKKQTKTQEVSPVPSPNRVEEEDLEDGEIPTTLISGNDTTPTTVSQNILNFGDVDLQRFNKGELSAWVRDAKGSAALKSPKMLAIVEIIQSIPVEDKIVIFSMFTSALDLIKKSLKHHLPKIKVAQIDGSTVGTRRNEILNAFRSNNVTGSDKSPRILLLSKKVGSEGLNLVEANRVIHVEPWWSPAVQFQAESRCWRPGQLKPVYSYSVIAQRCLDVNEIMAIFRDVSLTDEQRQEAIHDLGVTVEDRILELCQSKEEMATEILSHGDMAEKATIGLQDIGRLIH